MRTLFLALCCFRRKSVYILSLIYFSRENPKESENRVFFEENYWFLMAETLTKTSFVSSWNGNRNQQHQRVSMVPKTCSFNTGLKSFPSLKMKSQFLRSSSFSSDFHGKKPLFRVNRSIPKRVNSQFSVSAAPKVGHKS
jgi:hypothetical protein